jgi:peptide/nickel transport system substrate-binding protein
VNRRLSLSLLMLAAGAALLVAAGLARPAGTGSAAETRKGGTLRLLLGVDVDSVDPALAYVGSSAALEFATCAKLFNYPDKPGAAGTRVIPEVVKRFPSISKDGRTYTFDLKKTFRFHTGAPVTALSFADAFNRDANPKMDANPTRRSWAVNYMHEIVGADAVINGKKDAISGVRVLGRYRLQIRLTRPLGDFTARLTLPAFCPILPNTPIDPAGIDDPPGSGPYYVAERVRNKQIVLKRNPFYHGGRPANVDQMVFTVFTGQDPAGACELAIEQDRIDLCFNAGLSDAMYRRIAQRYGINRPGGQFFVSRSPGLGTWYFAFNHDRPAFKGRGQIPLAKAINYAIDRPALARVFGYLASRPTDQILSPTWGRNASIYPIRGADPATARKWRAKAKLKPRKLVLYTYNNSLGVGLGEQFRFDLKQIGIDVDVKTFEQREQIKRAGTRGEPFDVALNGWGVDYADGATFFEPLLNGKNIRRSGTWNFSYFDDAKTNAKMEATGRLTGDARRRAWAELDVDLMRTNPPWAPIIHGRGRAFISKSFGCFRFHLVAGFDLAAACKK